jgi:hypothetical protein
VSASGTTPDTTPNAFSFTATTGATRGTLNVSSVVTLAGMDANQTTTVSASGGTLFYSTDGTTFNYANSVGDTGNSPSTSASISTNNKYIKASGTSSSSYSGTTTVSVNYGTTTASYTITSEAPDTKPDAFTFGSTTGVALSAIGGSELVTLSGMDANQTALVSVTGGTLYYYAEVGVVGGVITPTTPASISTNNKYIYVVGTSSSSYSTDVIVSVNYGGTIGTLTITTKAAPILKPTAFSFGSSTGVALNTSKTSGVVTLQGMTAGETTSVSVTEGGTLYYSSDNSSFSSMTDFGSISTNNIYVYVTGTSSSSYSTNVTVSVNYGGTTGTYTITTIAAPFASPAPFTGTSTYAAQILPFTYTATHTRTYTVTATGFDCRLSLNGSDYQDDDNAPGNGETTSTITTLTAGDKLNIYVTGAIGGPLAKFGTITVTIT